MSRRRIAPRHRHAHPAAPPPQQQRRPDPHRMAPSMALSAAALACGGLSATLVDESRAIMLLLCLTFALAALVCWPFGGRR